MLELLTYVTISNFDKQNLKILTLRSIIAGKTNTTRKSAYHHGDLRQQLVNATRQVVEEKGPDKFSVSEACRAAGVSTAAPYRHFKDKQEMLIAVAIDGMIRMREQMLQQADGHVPGSVDAISALGMAYIDFAVAEPGVFRLMFGLTKDHETDPVMMEAGRAAYGVLLHQVATYKEMDLEDIMLPSKAFPLWTMVHGTSFLLIDGKVDVMDMEVDVPTMVRNATQALLGPRPQG